MEVNFEDLASEASIDASPHECEASVLGQESVGVTSQLNGSDTEEEEREWVIVRNVCAKAWHFDEDTKRWKAGSDVAPEFWGNYEYSPIIAEASLGLFELVPKAPIVPDVPLPVLDKCLKAKRFIEEEAKLFMVVSDGNMYDEEGNLITG